MGIPHNPHPAPEEILLCVYRRRLYKKAYCNTIHKNEKQVIQPTNGNPERALSAGINILVITSPPPSPQGTPHRLSVFLPIYGGAKKFIAATPWQSLLEHGGKEKYGEAKRR